MSSGARTAGYVISSLTWAFPNNWLGFVGFEFHLRFWASLFSGRIGEFFTIRGLSGTRIEAAGLARQGAFANEGLAWTLQHTVNVLFSHLDKQKWVRIYVPAEPFEPTHYGSLLGLALESSDEGNLLALLRGSRPGAEGALDWGREGGPGVAVYPGSWVPWFPSGGFHFPERENIEGPTGGRIVELEVGDSLGFGTIQSFLILRISSDSTGLDVDALILLNDAAQSAQIARLTSVVVESGRSLTRIGLDTATLLVDRTTLRVRGLSAVQSTEAANAGTSGDRLSTAGTSGAYRSGDPLRLSQGGAILGSVMIARLEARIAIDAPLPAALVAPLIAFQGGVPGAASNALPTSDPQIVDFTGGNVPTLGDVRLLSSGPNSLVVVIVGLVEGSATQRRVDRAVTSLGAPGTILQAQAVAVGLELGRRSAAVEPEPQFTYSPEAVRTAPAAGFVIIDDASGTRSARAVSAVEFDELVLATGRPGDAAVPYQVERFETQPPDITNATVEQEASLTLATNITLDGVALELVQFATATQSVAATADYNDVTVNGTSVIPTPSGALGAPPPFPAPGDLCAFQSGTTTEWAVARTVRATVGFDRPIALAPDGLEVFRLAPASFTYLALRVDSLVITVLPATATVTRVDMPRFAAGNLVTISWTVGTTPAASDYRITAVDGTTLELTGGTAIPGGASNVTLVLLDVRDPGTGGTRLGIRGIAIAAPAGDPNAWARFDVWRPDALRNEAGPVAILSGGEVFPARVATAVDFEIVVASALTLSGSGVSLFRPMLAERPSADAADTAPARAYIRRFTQDGAVVRFTLPADVDTASGNLIAAIPFRETDRMSAGTLEAGSVLIPEALDHAPLSRYDSLVEHELRHTQQYLWFGPIMFTAFPAWIFDVAIAAAAPGTELPEFSKFVRAKLLWEDAKPRLLFIPNYEGVDFRKDATVQISQGTTLVSVKLGEAFANNAFTMAERVSIPDGECFVRLRLGSQTSWYAVLAQLHKPFTPGGLMNILSALTWGTAWQLVGRFFYLIGRLIGGSGEKHKGTVIGSGSGVRLADRASATALLNEQKVILRGSIGSGDNEESGTIVRTVGSVNEATGEITFAAAIEMTGEVEISPYTTLTPGALWDWTRYYPATAVPDRPAALRLETINGDRLELAPLDRVKVVANTETHGVFPVPWLATDFVVTAIDGDIVELDGAPPFSGTGDPSAPGGAPTERTLRVAKIGHQDPLGAMDSRLLDEYAELGWMRAVNDPFTFIHQRANPRPGSFADVFARVGRHLLGTSSWSVLPIFGYYFWDNGFRYCSGTEFLSFMEQDASEHSGRLYTSLGRLEGQVIRDADDKTRARATVGDIFTYWFWHAQDQDSNVDRGSRDTPGAHRRRYPCVLPLATAETGDTTREPNRGAEAPAAAEEPGLAIPDGLFVKDLADPREASTVDDPLTVDVTEQRRFHSAHRGTVPLPSGLDLTYGMYTAFTRAGTHRVTARDAADGTGDDTFFEESRIAHDGDTQPIFFTVDVSDVTVSVAGRNVARNDQVTLLRTQRASVVVTPSEDRQYALTCLRSANGAQLRADGLSLEARNSGAAEPVELSRIHAYDSDAESYTSGGLAARGLHIPGDLHIPVRWFQAAVTDTPPLLNALPAEMPADPYDAPAAELRSGGSVFLLIASDVLVPPAGLAQYEVPPTGPAAVPAPFIEDATPGASVSVRSFLSGGAAFEIRLDANDPPEENAQMPLEFDVGRDGNEATLSVSVAIRPHFRLTAPSFAVARGAAIELECTDGVTTTLELATITPSAGITLEVPSPNRLRIIVSATATLGEHTVIVRSAADENQRARRTITITA